MQVILNILVGLSPVIFVVSVPAFAWSVWIGARNRCPGRPEGKGSIFLTLAGGFGLMLDAIAVAFMMTDNPHGRSWDSIDTGLLTGVPTWFVVVLSVVALGVMSRLVLWAVRERLTGTHAETD